MIGSLFGADQKELIARSLDVASEDTPGIYRVLSECVTQKIKDAETEEK